MGETILPASLHEYLDLIFMETASTLFNSDWTFADHQQPSTCQSSTQTEAPPDRDFSDISHTHQAVNAKIPIVRNPHPKIYTSSSRVGQACGNCREQKAKCSGHRPTCNRCQISGAHCSYGERKGIMMLKKLSDLTKRVEALEALIRDLYPKLDTSSAQQVDRTLEELNLRASLT